ncbi:MAG: neutral/alkaline non-lysosomal ceramidase N-terminal domain-containing protein [Rhodospirillaceae bacterium]|nr:neutral/alkaline non-lysosomal ceramidase N-terminal domain-containing protein [Rhodospirillaceae bacterium]
MSKLRVGVGRTDITPPVGIAHTNWGARVHDRAEGIDMELWATAMIIEDGNTKAVLMDVDFGSFGMDESDELRKMIGDVAGVPAEAVRLAYTHTHAGPPWSVSGGFGGNSKLPGAELVPAYQDYVRAQLVGAVRQAMMAPKQARVIGGYGKSDITVNRRFKGPSGAVLVAENRDGYVDQTVTAVRIDDLDEKPIASIVGFGTHPITLAHQNRLISPDYPGTVKRVVEQLTGAPCLFLQGCAGDQMPEQGLTGDVRIPRRIGTRLGAEASRVLMALRTRPIVRRFDKVVESGAPLGLWAEDTGPEAETKLVVTTRKAKLPVRNYGSAADATAEQERLAQAMVAIDKTKASPQEISDTNARYKRAAMNAHWARITQGQTHMSVDLHGIRLGNVGLIGAPLEPFSRIGARVRDAAPLPVVQLAGYSNGWQGYVPVADAYAEGGYETEWATPYAPTAAETLEKEALALLKTMAA